MADEFTRKTYKDFSRTEWSLKFLEVPEKGLQMGDEAFFRAIAVGTMQRLAAASEIMAKSYSEMIRELDLAKKNADRYEAYWRDEMAESARLRRSITAYKANFTRLKAKKTEPDKSTYKVCANCKDSLPQEYFKSDSTWCNDCQREWNRDHQISEVKI